MSTAASSFKRRRLDRLSRSQVAASAAFFVPGLVVGLRFGATAESFFKVSVIGVLVAISLADLRRRAIPNNLVLPAWALALLANTVLSGDWRPWLLWSLLAGLGCICLSLVSPGGFGMGDAKLVAFLGAVLGSQLVPALFLGAVGGAIFGIVIICRQGWSGRKQTFAFGPFLAAGAIAVLLVS